MRQQLLLLSASSMSTSEFQEDCTANTHIAYVLGSNPASSYRSGLKCFFFVSRCRTHAILKLLLFLRDRKMTFRKYFERVVADWLMPFRAITALRHPTKGLAELDSLRLYRKSAPVFRERMHDGRLNALGCIYLVRIIKP